MELGRRERGRRSILSAGSGSEQEAEEHDWFHVRRVAASSHFPILEHPAAIADAIETFVERLD